MIVMKNAIKNFGASVIAISMLLASSTAAIANNEKNKVTSSIELAYVGKLEHGPVYQLNIVNAENDEYYISFSDDAGNILYSANTKSDVFSQRFMINVEEVGDQPLTVTISSRKTNKTQVYTIKRSQNLVEENVVKRIK